MTFFLPNLDDCGASSLFSLSYPTAAPESVLQVITTQWIAVATPSPPSQSWHLQSVKPVGLWPRWGERGAIWVQLGERKSKGRGGSF